LAGSASLHIIANYNLPLNRALYALSSFVLEQRYFYPVFYAKLGLPLALISVASFTFFKGGNAINFVLALVNSVKVHGQVLLLRVA